MGRQKITKWMVMSVLVAVGMLLLAGRVVAGWLPQGAPRGQPYRHIAPVAPAQATGIHASDAATVWSSGWVDIQPGQVMTFTHNVGGDPALYAVDLWYQDTREGGLGIHHRAYGGMDVAGQRHGVHWQNLTDSSIRVFRQSDDVAAGQIRLRIWQPDPPEYNSGWVDIQAGEAVTLTHNLGGDVDDYTVGMKFRDTTPDGRGIHQFAFGGLAAGRAFYGAAWQHLTDTTIQAVRFGNDTSVQQVRIFITRPDEADYDSGWVDVAQDQTRTITHNLGGNPHGYVVRASARSAGLGINTRAAGGMEVGGQFFGANWENLTGNTIDVFRRPHDVFADQARVRIWRPERRIYLPLIVRNVPAAVGQELAYDDGTAESSQSYTAGNGFAVRFTTPSASAQLARARYYFIAPVAPIEVHVWDADRNDLITPFTATPSGDGWFDVDLSSLNLTVSGDFYVGFLYTVDTDPTLGVDTSASDSRSYEVPWEEKSYDYMIRAVVVPR
ncbi:MAG: hypothetical protein ACE5LU_02670 [Anaerolineae bacterium]